MRQELIHTDSNTPDYMLTFNSMVYRGYDTESDRNKKESISIYKYPLCLYVAYKQILRHADNPRLQYISDVQRYSTLLGHAILEHSPLYIELEQQYDLANDSENPYIQDMLDSVKSYTFESTLKTNRRAIKTLFFIKESLETKSNVLGINCTDLIIICSLLGIESANLSQNVKDQVKKECTFFKNFIPIIKSKYSLFQKTV